MDPKNPATKPAGDLPASADGAAEREREAKPRQERVGSENGDFAERPASIRDV